jgi:hypothetical protein
MSEEWKPVIFLAAEDLFMEFRNKSGYEMLVAMGKHPTYIAQQIQSHGTYFLFLIESKEDSIVPATWDGVGSICKDIFPDFYPYYCQHLEQLKQTPIEAIEKAAGYTFYEVDKKFADERFLTYERWMKLTEKEKNNLVNIRSFLYYQLRLLELFKGLFVWLLFSHFICSTPISFALLCAGDGYTYDDKGNKGGKEFLAPNKPLNQFHSYSVSALDVVLPESDSSASSIASSSSSSS